MIPTRILEVDETVGKTFEVSEELLIGIDIFVEDITIEWLSPDNIWVELGTRKTPGLWRLEAFPDIKFRVKTTNPGTQVWLYS